MERKSIIAMKGPPFTKKTTYAELIGTFLKFPVLSMEHFLDDLRPEYLQPASPQAHDLAFKIICRMTKFHLQKDVSLGVVIDSSLSSRSHLNQLVELARSLYNTRLVIIECKPQKEKEYLWKMEFEQFINENPHESQKWYKAKNRNDLEKAIQEEEKEDSGGNEVSKLLVHPFTETIGDEGHIRESYHVRIMEFLSEDKESFDHPLFVEAVKHMIDRRQDNDPVYYHDWKKSYMLLPDSIYIKENCDDGSGSGQFSAVREGKLMCCKSYHTITEYTEAELGYKAYCDICKKQVMAQAYSCKDCNLVLHKECAELSGLNQGKGIACRSCTEVGKGFSDSCMSCLSETDLKHRPMPTIVRHEFEKHFLCQLPPQYHFPVTYRCAACGKVDQFNMYSCKICDVSYHYKCLMRPTKVEHVHGGHHHRMELQTRSEEAEDHLCYVCSELDDKKDAQRLRDPMNWFYSCLDCPFYAHIDCVH